MPVTVSLDLPKIAHKTSPDETLAFAVGNVKVFWCVIRFSNYLTVNTVYLYIMTNRLMMPRGIWRHCSCKGFIPSIYAAREDEEIFNFNPLNAELNPICCLLALLGAHHFLHVSRIRVKSLTLRQLMSYIYGAPILDVSRSHTTTHHSR